LQWTVSDAESDHAVHWVCAARASGGNMGADRLQTAAQRGLKRGFNVSVYLS